MKTIGIIGFGSFGQLVASLLPPSVTVLVHDKENAQASLAEVAKADAIVLAIPLKAYPAVLQALKPLLNPQTLVIDVCSVKVHPQELLARYLPGQPILATHPLFGPQSASVGNTSGHTLVVTSHVGESAKQVLDFCEQELGLKIVHMTAEEHDQQMAQVQAVTFFVARALRNAGAAESQFATPSYSKLLELVRLDAHHSDELFATIEQGNPFAAQARDKLVKEFIALNKELNQE